MINNFFPKKIHAVTQKGFALKLVSFILVFAMQFLQVASWVNIEPGCSRLKRKNLMICPRCWSGKIIENGSIHNGRQKYMCR